MKGRAKMDKELLLEQLEKLKGKVLECDGAKIKSKKLSTSVRLYCDKFGIGQYGYSLYFFKNNEIISDFPLQDIEKLELKEKETKKEKKKEKKKKEKKKHDISAIKKSKKKTRTSVKTGG